MKEKEWGELLKKVYSSPGHAAAFSSGKRLQQEIKKSYKTLIPMSYVNEWLQTNYSYSLHKRARVVFPRNPIIASHIDNQWQGDLLFLPDLARANKGFGIALLCIDVFSRYAWGEILKSKHGAATRDAFETILKRAHPRKPEKFQTDKGKEFLNAQFQKLLKDNDILFFTTSSDFKAAIAERLIKTIKGKIYRYLDDHNTLNYIDQFQNIIMSYNKTYHSTIKMAPIDVSMENMQQVTRNLYGFMFTDSEIKTEPLLKVGDYVRISKVKSKLFRKEYKGNWTEELFKISKVQIRKPHNIYRLVDLNNKEIDGAYYYKEIQKVPPIDEATEEYKIEKILRTRVKNKKKEHFVKWLGYPDEFNSWIKASNIKSVK